MQAVADLGGTIWGNCLPQTSGRPFDTNAPRFGANKVEKEL